MVAWLLFVYALLASFFIGATAFAKDTPVNRTAALTVSVAFVVVALIVGICSKAGVL